MMTEFSSAVEWNENKDEEKPENPEKPKAEDGDDRDPLDPAKANLGQSGPT